MAKKKPSRENRTIRVPAATPQAGPKTTPFSLPEDSCACFWPEALIPKHRALFMMGAAFVLAVLVFGAASVGGFTALKISLASLLGVSAPEQVYASNFDIAYVLFAIVLVALAGSVHPGLGIGLIVLARSWTDGYTFPLDNIYFTWSICLLGAIWLVGVLKRKERIHFPVPAYLFSGLLLIMAVTLPFAYQYYNTYSLFWLWVGYGFLFLLTLNTMRNTTVSGVLLTIFMIAMAAQAVFSILHFEYLLPYLRQVVQDPAVLRQYFKTDVMSADMARRFMVNRAFGTMLFPNALAAYLLLGLPFLLAMVVPYGKRCQEAFKNLSAAKAEPAASSERIGMIGVASVVGFAVVLGVHFVAYFPKSYVYHGTMSTLPIYLRNVPLAVLSLAGGCVIGLVALYLLMRWGFLKWWLAVRFAGSILIALVVSYACWITYSRGAFLALLMAMVWAFFLYAVNPRRFPGRLAKISPRGVALGAVLALLAVGFVWALAGFSAPTAGWADETSEAAQSPGRSGEGSGPQVHQEGISLSMQELADPASFRLRLGYWQVAFRMALHNWRTGVGMGNFAIAYPRYQHIGAGDVREAHNGFLQFFSETGLAGGMLFAAFWGFLGIWGAWRIVREENKHEKLVLLGMYTGLVAFCLHAFLDINFSHPSLMMYAMVFCGLFYARARMPVSSGAVPDEDVSPGNHVSRRGISDIAVLLFLVVLVATVCGSARIYLQHLALNRMRFLNLSCEEELDRHLKAGHFFFNELSHYALQRDQGRKAKALPRIPLSLARLILDDLETLDKGCTFYKPIPETRGQFARLEKGDPIPDNALVVVQKAWMMRRAAGESALEWVRELELQDRWFPHSPELAMHLAKWYEFYVQAFVTPAYAERRPEWIRKFMDWSEIMLYRNPMHADMRLIRANALVWKLLEAPEGDEELLWAQAQQEFEEMLRLSPIFPRHKLAYAGVLERMTAYFEETAQNEQAAVCREKADLLQQEAKEQQEERNATGLYSRE